MHAMIPPGRIDCHVHFYPPAFADMLLSAEGGPIPGPRPGGGGPPAGAGPGGGPPAGGRPGGGPPAGAGPGGGPPAGPGREALGQFVLAPKPEWRDLAAL